MTSPADILKKYWGYDTFREPQLQIIESVLKGDDTLALMPTGGGKSVCFQVPAMMRSGLCIVVSPLIALMKDQVEQLRNRNIMAAAIFSGMSRSEIETTLNNAVNGAYKFLYVSPERLKTTLFIEKVHTLKINLLAVDEAHCVSQWGYDFRPEYLQIAEIRPYLNGAPVMALTASATAAVTRDIIDRLQLKPGVVFRKSFERKNLRYHVRITENKDQKLLEICRHLKGSGIVYTNSRRQTQDVARWLNEHQLNSAFYHAGLSTAQRDRIQNDWIKNKIRIIACTNAFGMGIDKPDVRFVLHYKMPASLEAYYQEAGRAGRDGKDSLALVLFHENDALEAREWLAQKHPDKATIRRCYELLCNFLRIPAGSGMDASFEFDMAQFCKETGLKANIALAAFQQLEHLQMIQSTPALYTPSKVFILTDRETLYRYQLKNKPHDEIIKAMLRTYGGIFDFHTKIQEKDIAERVPGCTPAKVKECLETLHRLQYIDYVPQSDAPKITFLSPRIASAEINFDDERSAFLKKVETDKLESALHYVKQHDTCRSMVILKYFDETSAKPCGVCDVCMERIKKEMPDARFKQIYNAIEKAIFEKPLTADALIKTLNAFPPSEINHVLQYLLRSEVLELNKNQELCLA